VEEGKVHQKGDRLALPYQPTTLLNHEFLQFDRVSLSQTKSLFSRKGERKRKEAAATPLRPPRSWY